MPFYGQLITDQGGTLSADEVLYIHGMVSQKKKMLNELFIAIQNANTNMYHQKKLN